MESKFLHSNLHVKQDQNGQRALWEDLEAIQFQQKKIHKKPGNLISSQAPRVTRLNQKCEAYS